MSHRFRTNRFRFSGVAAVPAMLAALACVQPGSASASAADGVLRVGTSFSCSSLNPYTTVQSSCLAALRLMYP